MPLRVDLRSDTVTRPTPAMYEAMARAPLGDDVLGDDPTVSKLEESVADLLGHEAGLFVPSGTMGNQVALAVHCRPGDSALFDEEAHMLYYEGGSPAVLAGVLAISYESADGVPSLDSIRSKWLERSVHTPGTTCVCAENTHNRHGGAVTDRDTLAAMQDYAVSKGAIFHIDGARIWNAAIALGVTPKELANHAHSMSVCLSKGLGAPVGSVLVGNGEFIEEARFWRKRLGGGMRQSGLLAACGLVAIEQMYDRLAEDHVRAKRLATLLDDVNGMKTKVPATNIVIVETVIPANTWVDALASHGIGAVPFGPNKVRFVTHYDVDDAGIELAYDKAQEIAASLSFSPGH
ncbi:MAG: low specificity L-threonine aldolase [Nitrospira sp.]|nr:low specificity L-threonine aldolase [Nitrospira sp.]